MLVYTRVAYSIPEVHRLVARSRFPRRLIVRVVALACPCRKVSAVALALAYISARLNLLAPHTSGPRDVPRCGALSLLQKDAALQGGDTAETAVG